MKRIKHIVNELLTVILILILALMLSVGVISTGNILSNISEVFIYKDKYEKIESKLSVLEVENKLLRIAIEEEIERQ